MAKNVKIRDVTYNDVPIMRAPYASGSGYALFYDTTEASGTSPEDVKAGKTFFGENGEQVGTMTENGTVTSTISSKTQVVTIAEGHHSGSGTVQLSEAEKAKLVSGNIKAGVTLLSISGKSTVIDTEIASSDAAAAANISRGKKAAVNGNILTGTMDSVVVSQDPTTKVLTIE